ncbi:MAG: ABC transporter permease [Lentisphaeria bacterium]|nr:ABC transporter permease [Lentisphaeria bacterium]
MDKVISPIHRFIEALGNWHIRGFNFLVFLHAFIWQVLSEAVKPQNWHKYNRLRLLRLLNGLLIKSIPAFLGLSFLMSFFIVLEAMVTFRTITNIGVLASKVNYILCSYMAPTFGAIFIFLKASIPTLEDFYNKGIYKSIREDNLVLKYTLIELFIPRCIGMCIGAVLVNWILIFLSYFSAFVILTVSGKGHRTFWDFISFIAQFFTVTTIVNLTIKSALIGFYFACCCCLRYRRASNYTNLFSEVAKKSIIIYIIITIFFIWAEAT